jgi:SNF2 family DNA or RNA helicase
MIPAVDRIVVDEAHVMRNQNKMFKKLIEISMVTRYRWGITATPFNNSDSDMLAYVKFLKPMGTANPMMFSDCFMRKLRSDVIKGGPVIKYRKVVYDFETEDEKNLYDYVSGRIDDASEWIRANTRRIPWRQRGHMMMTLILRQRQAAIHPQLVLNAEKIWARELDRGVVDDWDPSKVTKANKIVEMVLADQQNGKSTMVVTHFGEEIVLLKQRIEAEGIPVSVLNGKTKPKVRRELELPKDRPTVLLLQIQAGGVGISLPWVHHVINASPDWNPFLEQQSIYRAYRITTPHDVDVTSLYFRNTVDIHIQERQREKMEKGAAWLGDDPRSILPFVEMPAI